MGDTFAAFPFAGSASSKAEHLSQSCIGTCGRPGNQLVTSRSSLKLAVTVHSCPSVTLHWKVWVCHLSPTNCLAPVAYAGTSLTPPAGTMCQCVQSTTWLHWLAVRFTQHIQADTVLAARVHMGKSGEKAVGKKTLTRENTGQWDSLWSGASSDAFSRLFPPLVPPAPPSPAHTQGFAELCSFCALLVQAPSFTLLRLILPENGAHSWLAYQLVWVGEFVSFSCLPP